MNTLKILAVVATLSLSACANADRVMKAVGAFGEGLAGTPQQQQERDQQRLEQQVQYNAEQLRNLEYKQQQQEQKQRELERQRQIMLITNPD